MATSYAIGPHFEGLVRHLVESGRYASPSEVMRDGLRLIEEREQMREAKLQSLRAALREGIESGELAPLDMREVRAKAQERRISNSSGERDSAAKHG